MFTILLRVLGVHHRRNALTLLGGVAVVVLIGTGLATGCSWPRPPRAPDPAR